LVSGGQRMLPENAFRANLEMRSGRHAWVSVVLSRAGEGVAGVEPRQLLSTRELAKYLVRCADSSGRGRRRRQAYGAPPADDKLLPPRQQVVSTRRVGKANLPRSRYEYSAGRVLGSPSGAAGADPLSRSLGGFVSRLTRHRVSTDGWLAAIS
jgi:hypothetical protein